MTRDDDPSVTRRAGRPRKVGRPREGKLPIRGVETRAYGKAPGPKESIADELRRTPVQEAEEAGPEEVDRDLLRELGAMEGQTEELTVPAEERASHTGRHAAQVVAPPPEVDRRYWEERAARLEREAGAATSARRAAVLHYELGRLVEGNLGDEERALECYRASHHRWPGLGVNNRSFVRLLSRRGDHAGVVRVMDTELSGAPSAAERVAVLVDRALYRVAHLRDLAGARADLTRALEIDPEDPLAIEALTELARHEGDHDQTEALLRRQLRLCEDPALRSAYLCEVGRLREAAGDLEGAAGLFHSALNAAPTNQQALRALLRVARANRDYPVVAKLYESLGEAEDGPMAAAALWEASRYYAGRLRNAEMALRAVEQAAERAPDDLAVQQDLAQLLEREKKWAGLAVALQRSLELVGQGPDGGAIAFQLARVQVERLQDPDAAIGTLRTALRLDPRHMPARMLLARLYQRKGLHAELVALLADELALFTDPSHGAAIHYRIADLYETKLLNGAAAAEHYQEALRLQPGYRPAMRGVSRVYHTEGRYEELIATYERDLAQTTEREQKVAILRRIAELWETRLADPDAAVSAHERLLFLEPANLEALRALRRIYTLTGRWEHLVSVLRTEADQTHDRWRAVALLEEVAEVQEHELKDGPAALETHLAVLDRDPTHQPALMAAGRLLQRGGRHEQLLQLHRRELDHTEETAHRTWLLMKSGRLLLEQLQRPEEAAVCFAEALKGDLDRPAAADQLVRLYRQTGNHAELFQLLTRLPPAEVPAVQALHHRRLAELLQHGQRPALAVEHLRRAARVSEDDAAVQHLARLYAAVGDRQNLIAVHQLELKRARDPWERAFACTKLARLWSGDAHQLERAVEALDRVLELSPRNAIVLRQLEVLLARLQRWEALAAVLELTREPCEDQDYRQACAVVVAALREDRLDDLRGAAQSAVEVLVREPAHAEALATLERHARTSGQPEELAQVLGRYAKAAQTVPEQAAMLTAIASVHANGGQLKQALELFRLAAEQLPSYLPAVRGWHRAARASGDAASMARSLELEAEASLDLPRRSGCFFEAGRIWQLRVEDPLMAVAAYRRVLTVDPRHQGAISALTGLFTSRREHKELVTLLSQVAEAAPTVLEQRELLARIAELQRSRLQDTLGARRTIVRALELAPDDRALLTTLAELCRGGSDYKALAGVDRRLVRLTEDPVLLKALHFELGMIWDEKLPDPDRAAEEYRRVLELDPNDLGALTRLSRLLIKREAWQEAVAITEQLIQRDDDRNRVKDYHLQLAQIYADGFGDLRRAQEACRRALALDPGDLKGTEVMAVILRRQGDLRGLHAHLESSLTVHRARLDRDPFRIDSYQALLSVFGRQEAPDRVYVARSVLASVGAATEADRAYVKGRRSHAPLLPPRPVTNEEVEGQIVHPDGRGPLRLLLLGAEAALRRAVPHETLPTPRPAKLAARTDPELAELVHELCKALGGVTVQCFRTEGGLEQLRVEDTATPSLYLPRDVELSGPELRLRIARALARVRLRHLLALRHEPEDLGRLVAATLSVICASYSPPYPAAELEAWQAVLGRSLNRKQRAELETVALELGDRPLQPEQWVAAMRQSEDRLALVICGDVPAAVRMLLRDEGYQLRASASTPADVAAMAGPRLRHLLCFAVSEEHLTLRERLGIALPA